MDSGTLILVIGIAIVVITVATSLFTIFKVLGSLRANTSGGPKKFRQNRKLGIGTLINFSQTGVHINQQPQMRLEFRIQAPGGVDRTGTAVTVIPLHELAALNTGTMLPVWFDPDDPNSKIYLATDADPQEATALLSKVRLENGQMTAQEYDIQARGVDAPAVVMNVQPTGRIEQGNSILSISLRVNPTYGESFDVTVEKAIPQRLLPQIQPGVTINVMYLPEDTSSVVLSLSNA